MLDFTFFNYEFALSSSLPSLVGMIVHLEIGVAQFFGGIGQPVDVADQRPALQDQVRLFCLQDVFAQAWVIQQADRGHRYRNGFFHRAGVRHLIAGSDWDIRLPVKQTACGNIDAIDAVLFEPFPDRFPVIQAVLLF